MKRTFLILWIMLLMLMPLSLWGYELEEKIEKTFTTDQISKLSLENVNGDINIRGDDTGIIQIKAFKYLKASGKKDAEHAIKDLKVNFRVDDGVLYVDVDRPESWGWGILNWLFGGIKDSRVYFEITIPEDLNLRLSTVNGDIELRNIKGELKAHTVNGDIKAYGVEYNADLKTVNGRLRVIVDDNRGEKINVKTVNGRIELMINPEVGFTLNAKTVNGSIRSDFNEEDGDKSIVGEKATIEYGDGRLQIQAKTVNGSISINRL